MRRHLTLFDVMWCYLVSCGVMGVLWCSVVLGVDLWRYLEVCGVHVALYDVM